ncbi:uracil-DNA glycosylase [Cystobasidium minutum MCA 4210]|uniref:uracil-DNA glycosylase n=1 Tax=Cystobasidium minutum MCA 4210 TaxID=1397322 RepID=UPI0034CF63D4|eukprot:jgi/Rhomi1/147422/e_gw1.8.335.1
MPNEVAKDFLDSLSDEATEGKGGPLSHRQLLELEGRTMHPSWLTPLQKEMRKSYFLKLKRFLWTEGVKTAPEVSKNIFPPAGEIYSWSRFTPLDKVRVVILGQDPYHNNGQAHGLAFSVRSNVAVPPSLRNIYKEIKNDYPDFQVPKHGYLGSWARQGVLMLNTSLSVRAHQANSHSNKGWEQFTDSILKTITSRPGPGVVFFAWGNPAQKRTASIIKKHLVLKSVHPSPLSANRGFFGNGHFRKANEWLKENYGEEGMIDWCTLDPEER